MLPGAVCAAAALLGWVVGRRSTRGRDAVLGVGVAAAFVASMFALEMGPDFPLRPSEDGWLWIVWIAVAGAVVGVVGSFVRVPLVVRVLAMTGIGCWVAWQLTNQLPRHVPAGFLGGEGDTLRSYAYRVILVAPTPLLALALADARSRPSKLSLAAPICIALAASAGVLAAFGHSLRMGMAAGALGVAVGATVVFGWRRRGAPSIPPSAAAVIAPVFWGILVSALGYLNYGDTVAFPVSVALLLVTSALACIARSWKAALILAVLFAGGAAVVAGVHDAKNGPVTEGW